MSVWTEVKSSDIEVDANNRQVDILIDSNDFGNWYLVLTFDQIADIVREANDRYGTGIICGDAG